MDKFQKRILYNGNANQKDTIPYCFTCEEEKSGNKWPIAFNPDKDEFIIVQNVDIFSTVYYLYIEHTAIKSVFSKVDNVWAEATQKNDKFKVALDFDNKACEIKISFKYEIASDYIFKIQYKDADKELYYETKKQIEKEKKAKLEAEHKKMLDKAVDIATRTGNMLVNIHFNPCSPDCERTVIELYLSPANRPIAIYEAEKGVFFKSITGLAYGYYTFILKQYNSDQELIYESKSHSFSIHKPSDCLPGDDA